MSAEFRKALFLAGLLSLVPYGAVQAEPLPARPPYAGNYEPKGVDERGLWMQMDEYERTLQAAPGLVRDRGLQDYLRHVLCRTVGADRCASARIYVVQDSSFNASMAPNGLMFVHTGLLARLRSEAELATVLAHEFAHFEKRHSLLGFKSQRRTTDALAWLGLAAGIVGADASGIQNALVFGYFSFSREQETEADALAAAYMQASPYRLRTSAMWRRLIAEDAALRAERGIKSPRRKTPGLFDSHPTNEQRIAAFEKFEASASDMGEEGVESFRSATKEVLPLIFGSLIKGNDFAAADHVIRTRGDAMGWDGPLLYLRGELFRQRGSPRDFVIAADLFRQAKGQSDAPAETWRGLGLIEIRNGQIETGKASLREYLRRKPDAPDSAIVTSMLGA